MKKLIEMKDQYHETLSDVGLLIMRLWAGLAMAYAHGWPKLANFSDRADSFADPLGVGSFMSLTLTVGAEFFASILLALGLATRLLSIPLLFTMFVAAFIVHAGDPFGDRELALFFGAAYLMLIFTGPGKYSLDHIVKKGWQARQEDVE